MSGINGSRYNQMLGGGLAIAILVGSGWPTPAWSSTLDQLAVQERVALQNGEVLVSRSDGQFTGRVLVNASTDWAWQVLTDYDNFDQFMPNVESSRLLEAEGDRHVFEQVNRIQIFPISKRIRFAIAATENRPRQIQFTLVSGDVESLNGTWRLESIPGATPQVLVTHQVTINPEGGGLTRSVFLNTYSDILEDTLTAVKQETERRSR